MFDNVCIFQGSLSNSMSSLKSIAQDAVEKARLENQIPLSSHSPNANTKGNTVYI